MRLQVQSAIALRAEELLPRWQQTTLGAALEPVRPYWYQIMLLAVIPVAFWLDAHTSSIAQQNVLGACAWLLLILSMRLSPPAERRQVWIMVGVASAVEVWS